MSKDDLERAQARLDAKRAKVEAPPVGTNKAETIIARLVAGREKARQARERPDSGALSRAWASRDPSRIRAQQPLPPQEIERRRVYFLEIRGVPEAYLHCSKASWETRWKGAPTPWDHRFDAWSGDPWSITLRGRPGVGKTHISVAIFERLGQRTKRPLFISVPAAIRDIRDAYQANDGRTKWGKPPADFYKWAARTFGLILFDDVGAQPDRENWLAEVSGWIYDRHAAQLPTIVTLNPGDYRGLEDRAARRLNDGLVINLDKPCDV